VTKLWSLLYVIDHLASRRHLVCVHLRCLRSSEFNISHYLTVYISEYLVSVLVMLSLHYTNCLQVIGSFRPPLLPASVSCKRHSLVKLFILTCNICGWPVSRWRIQNNNCIIYVFMWIHGQIAPIIHHVLLLFLWPPISAAAELLLTKSIALSRTVNEFVSYLAYRSSFLPRDAAMLARSWES